MTSAERTSYDSRMLPCGYFCFGDDGVESFLKAPSAIHWMTTLPKSSGTFLNTSSLHFPDDAPLIPNMDKAHTCGCSSSWIEFPVHSTAHGFVCNQGLHLVSVPASGAVVAAGGEALVPAGLNVCRHIVTVDLRPGWPLAVGGTDVMQQPVALATVPVDLEVPVELDVPVRRDTVSAKVVAAGVVGGKDVVHQRAFGEAGKEESAFLGNPVGVNAPGKTVVLGAHWNHGKVESGPDPAEVPQDTQTEHLGYAVLSLIAAGFVEMVSATKPVSDYHAAHAVDSLSAVVLHGKQTVAGVAAAVVTDELKILADFPVEPTLLDEDQLVWQTEVVVLTTYQKELAVFLTGGLQAVCQ